MPFTPKNWADGPAGGTPIIEAELDRMETGIDDAHAGLIDTGAIATAKIADLAVTGAKIADLAVTGAKIADLAVTGAKIATDTITAIQLAANAIGSSELADGAVTVPKLTLPRCIVRRGTNFTVSDSLWTLVLWDAEVSDPDGMHSTVTNTARITVPNTGLYLVGFNIVIVNAGTVQTTVGVLMRKNTEVADGALTDSVAYQGLAGLAAGISHGFSAQNIVNLTANDFVAMTAFSNGVTNTIGSHTHMNQMYAVQIA